MEAQKPDLRKLHFVCFCVCWQLWLELLCCMCWSCVVVRILLGAGIKEDTNEGVCYEEYLLLLNGAQQLCHMDSP